jgi:thioredoxin 1
MTAAAAVFVVNVVVLLQCGVINFSSSSFVADAFAPHVNNNYVVNANNNNVNSNLSSRRRHRYYSPTPVEALSSLFPSGAARAMTSASSLSSSSTQLSMVAKSGGRLILTAEQFEREVLHLSSSSASSSISQQQHHQPSSSSSSATSLHTVKGGDHINHNTNSDHSNNNNNNSDNNILPVLVLFTAPWCGPCRLTSPVVTEIMTQYANKIHVLEISTDDLPDVAISVGVRSIPTILLYHEGIVQDIIVGCVAKNVLAHAVDKMLEELDKKKKSRRQQH